MAKPKKHIARRFIDELEETVIAVLLAAMVVVTFINVVLRYGFNTGLFCWPAFNAWRLSLGLRQYSLAQHRRGIAPTLASLWPPNFHAGRRLIDAQHHPQR